MPWTRGCPSISIPQGITIGHLSGSELPYWASCWHLRGRGCGVRKVGFSMIDSWRSIDSPSFFGYLWLQAKSIISKLSVRLCLYSTKDVNFQVVSRIRGLPFACGWSLLPLVPYCWNVSCTKEQCSALLCVWAMLWPAMKCRIPNSSWRLLESSFSKGDS